VSDKIRIVFDGPPGHESGRFVDVEDTNGRSIKIGEWVELPLGRAPFYALEIDDPRTLAQLRSDLARVTQERDEALREVQRKGAREIGLLSRALAAETQSDITQDALTAMRQERDALSAQLTTAVRDARATAAGDIQRAESERDAALSDLTAMRHRAEAAEREVERLRVEARSWEHYTARAQAAEARAERAEEELAGAWKNHDEQVAAKKRLVVAVRNETESDTAECIAAWLTAPDGAKCIPGGGMATLEAAADAIRAGAWKKETT
jgi:hypothetical protein